MGATHTKHPKPNEGLVANQPRRRSIRRSLRFSKGSSKDALSFTEKYLESLSVDFDKGIIYNLKLEELKNIETELNNILRDLDNLSAVGITSSKRFELENSTRYFRNKVKAAIDNHMDNAIQKLNDSFRIPETNDDGEEEAAKRSLPERNDLPTPPHTLIETDPAKITVKLKEISIKLREILTLLHSLDEIDDITRSSSLSIIQKCKRELYNLQTRNEKLISKKWKCYRRIDEIRNILGESKDSNSSKTIEVASELRKVRNDKTKTDKEGEDNYESDARGIEADVEDNEDKIIDSTNRDVENDADANEKLKELKTSSNHSNEKGDLDKINESKIRSIKLTIRNLYSFISSLKKVDETTKASTNEALRNCKKELKDLQLKNSTLAKKRTRRLKDIEELEAILHEKYCEASDGECNGPSSHADSETEKPLKLMKSAGYESDDQKQSNEDIQRRNATIQMSKSEPKNEAFIMTRELSENFDNTCKKISEILLRKSASYDDLEILTRRIGEINNQFDGLLKTISSIKEVRENTEEDLTTGSSHDKRNEKYEEQESFEWKNDSKCSDNAQYDISQEETKPREISKIFELSVTEEAYRTSSRKTGTFGKSSPDLVNIGDQNDRGTEILGKDFSTIREKRQSTVDKKYQQSYSVDELESTDKAPADYQRFSEQNLHKMNNSSSENLAFVRNIDLSQIASRNIECSTSDFHQENSIASKNIDLSQMIFRDSDISLSRADQHNSFPIVHATEEFSTEETQPREISKIVELSVTKEAYGTSRKTGTFRKSSPDLLNIADQNDRCTVILEKQSSTIREKRQSTLDKKIQQSYSVDVLESTDRTPVDYQRFSEQNLHKMNNSSSENLVSMRNIDLSQIASRNREVSTSDFHQENSIASRNIHLSQMVFRDSDLSLSRADQHNSFPIVHATEEFSTQEIQPRETSKTVELFITEEAYGTSSRKTGTFGKSSPDLDLVNIGKQNDRCTEILGKQSSTIREKRQSTLDKKIQQSYSVDVLETTDKAPADYQRFSEQNLHKMTNNSSENLVSMRNIDLSQIASRNREGSTSDFHQENSIASRNIDLSQMVFRDSDLSLSHVDQNNGFPIVHETEEYSTEDGGITITFKKHIEISSSQTELEKSVGNFEGFADKKTESSEETERLESSSSIVKIEKRDDKVSEQVQESLDIVQDERKLKLKGLEENLHLIKGKIMNFVGVKSDDLYNELDEELLSVMISLDGLGIDSNNPLYEEKEKIVKDVFKYSSMLETKNLDYQYLDSFEQEIQVVEKEIRQSLAKEKLENLRHIIEDVDDMLNEIENKIVDHLLVERRDKSIQRLGSIKDKLKYLTKSE